jgi:hypothetical protein
MQIKLVHIYSFNFTYLAPDQHESWSKKIKRIYATFYILIELLETLLYTKGIKSNKYLIWKEWN